MTSRNNFELHINIYREQSNIIINPIINTILQKRVKKVAKVKVY